MRLWTYRSGLSDSVVGCAALSCVISVQGQYPTHQILGSLRGWILTERPNSVRTQRVSSTFSHVWVGTQDPRVIQEIQEALRMIDRLALGRR